MTVTPYQRHEHFKTTHSMKILMTLMFIFSLSLGFSQTKEELIQSLIEGNIVESDCVGLSCRVGEQYIKFQKLSELLTEAELIELSRHIHPIIRTYVLQELILSEKGNVVELLVQELNKNQTVKTFEGCLIGYESIASIVYHEYWNKIRIEASEKIGGKQKERQLAMQERLTIDATMEQLDSVVIHSNEHNYWLLYKRAFENRKHKESYLPRIETLAFTENNGPAFAYLTRHYAASHKEKIASYFRNTFPEATFDKFNRHSHFHAFVTYLRKSKNRELKKIMLEKMKTEDCNWMSKTWYKRLAKIHGVKI